MKTVKLWKDWIVIMVGWIWWKWKIWKFLGKIEKNENSGKNGKNGKNEKNDEKKEKSSFDQLYEKLNLHGLDLVENENVLIMDNNESKYFKIFIRIKLKRKKKIVKINKKTRWMPFAWKSRKI